MRNKFDEQLHNLNDEMIKMGKLCEQAIAAAIKMAMDHANEELKAEVLDTDAEIDRKERVIENICMKLFLNCLRHGLCTFSGIDSILTEYLFIYTNKHFCLIGVSHITSGKDC